MPEPLFSAEEEHASPRDDRVAEGRDCDIGRYGRAMEHQLHPGKDQKQQETRPHPQCLGIGQVARKLAPWTDAAVEVLRPLE